MIPPGSTAWWRQLFERAVEAQPTLTGPHVRDDDELLALWSAGLLSPRELDHVLDHLDRCGSCRREVAALIRANVLRLPDGPPSTTLPFPVSAAAAGRRSRFPGWRPLALAAAVVAAIVLPVAAWRLVRPQPDPTLELAARDLDAGQSAEAEERLERWLEGQHPEAERQRALALLERAGVARARADLAERHFEQVRTRVQQLGAYGLDSAALRNLDLQADRGMPVELALAQAATLTAYGFLLDGSSPSKDLPAIDARTERLDREWKQALAEHPDDAALQVNYGQFLLTLDRTEEARDHFRQAVGRGEQESWAHLGWGLAAFKLGDYEAARQQFALVVQQEPDQMAGHVNLAMSLEQLQRADEARPHWEQAAALTQDSRLRRRILAHLERLKAPTGRHP